MRVVDEKNIDEALTLDMHQTQVCLIIIRRFLRSIFDH